MSDTGLVVVPAVPLAEGLPLLAGQQGQLGGVGVDEAAPALQRGRGSAAVLQQAGVGYHHFSASLRASNNGNGITCAGGISVSVSCSARPSACPAESWSPLVFPGRGQPAAVVMVAIQIREMS
jgi:hypothetical protein